MLYDPGARWEGTRLQLEVKWFDSTRGLHFLDFLLKNDKIIIEMVKKERKSLKKLRFLLKND